MQVACKRYALQNCNDARLDNNASVSESAFNTITPQVLVNNLVSLGVSTKLCKCILNFVSERKQHAYINEITG